MTAALAHPPAYQRPDGLWCFSRTEFAATRFDYEAGQHVVFGGPTQRGKTTLAFQLLEYCASPELPAYVAVSKPDDKVSEREGRRLGYRRVTDWPAPKKVNEMWNGKPPGYLIWPKFGDINLDVQRCSEVTARLISDRYTQGVRKKKGILVMDDTMVKSKIMGLDGQMTTMLAMSGAMGIGEWVFVQKPTDSGRTAIWAYGASEHLFLTHDPDENNQRRYGEIGGVDPKAVRHALNNLNAYEFLYLSRTGKHMCIVGAK